MADLFGNVDDARRQRLQQLGWRRELRSGAAYWRSPEGTGTLLESEAFAWLDRQPAEEAPADPVAETAESLAMPDECKSCHAPIVWVRSAARNKPVPCDPQVLTIVTEDGHFHRGRQSHFATCPHAKTFRLPGRPAAGGVR